MKKASAFLVVLGLTFVAWAYDAMPLQWIVSVKVSISAGDKRKLKNVIKNWVGADKLEAGGWPPMIYANAAGERRYIQYWWDNQLSKQGALTQAKIDAARALLADSNSVWITASYSPAQDLKDGGWTNCASKP